MNEKGFVRRGAALVWRHQRLVWWIFVVNYILALLATLPERIAIGKVLNGSLAATPLLVNRFDISALAELFMRRNVPMAALASASVSAAFVFLIYMVFLDGGILTVYLQDRKLSKAEFFENCGAFFWRMIRLLLFSIVPFGILAALYNALNKWSARLSRDASPEKLGFWVLVIGGFLVLLVFLYVRLWFDIAQVRAVAQDERGMFRNILRSFGITVRSLPSLVWMYFRISLVAWAVLFVGLWIWLHLPHAAVGRSMVLLEIVLLVQIATRLWQRASAINWYHKYAADHPVVAVEFTTPTPAEIVEPPAGSASPAPETQS